MSIDTPNSLLRQLEKTNPAILTKLLQQLIEKDASLLTTVTGTPDAADAIYLTGDIYTTALNVDTLGSSNSAYWTADSNIWVLAILEV